MTLIFSDLHLGRDPAGDPDRLADVLDCFVATASEAPVSDVIFLGDTFDAFVDSRLWPPKVVTMWGALVEDLRARGAAVTFFSGNHDRWHIGTIRAITGKEPARGPQSLSLDGLRCVVSHGDEADALSAAARLVKRISEQRWAAALYRCVLPFGLAQGLASLASRTFASGTVQQETVNALRAEATRSLDGGDVDLVVFGHAHQAEGSPHGHGAYMNTGDWFRNRTFVRLHEQKAMLCAWTDNKIDIRCVLDPWRTQTTN